MTIRALDHWLAAGPLDVADVGGGPGRYTQHLLRKGYRVTLVDLSPQCLDLARRTLEAEDLTPQAIVEADACDLSALPDAAFDAVLLMGPLYHLIDPADRLRAVREARRICRPGGLLIATFISRYAVLQWAARNKPDYPIVDRAEWRRFLDDGVQVMPGQPGEGFTDAWFCHSRDVEPLLQAGGFASERLLAVEPMVTYTFEDEASLTDAQVAAWVEMLFELCDDPTIVGSGCHLMAIGRAV